MRIRQIVVVAFLCLILSGESKASPSSDSDIFTPYLQSEQALGHLSRETALLYRIYALFDSDLLPAKYRQRLVVSPPLREGSLILREVQRRWQEWSPEFRSKVSPYFLPQDFQIEESPRAVTGLSKNPSFERKGHRTAKGLLTGTHRMAHWAQTANFNIEWGDNINWTSATSCGALFYDSSQGNEACPAGIPDLVKRWAEYFELSYQRIIDDMGYREPPYAGTGLIDVFIANTGCGGASWCRLTPQTLGLTATYCDSIFRWCQGPNAAYIRVNNHFFQEDVTAPHEFFHVIQFAYDTTGVWYDHDNWWLEATATWMEDQVFDGTNSYYSDIRRWVLNPEISLRSPNATHAYGSALFVFFLAETYGPDIVREIWDTPVLAGTIGLYVIDDVLKRASYQSDLYAAFKQFSAKNAFMDYEEGAEYGSVARLARHAAYPVSETVGAGSLSGSLEELGVHYISFQPATSLNQDLTIAFDGRDDMSWGVMAVAVRGQGLFKEISAVRLASQTQSGCLSFAGFGSDITEVLLIPSALLLPQASGQGSIPSYGYTARYNSSCETALSAIEPAEANLSPPVSSADRRCFIATAAYGSFEAPAVQRLRLFRDQYLIPYPLGKRFVGWYYRYSPPVADYIAMHPWAAQMTRLLLLPILGICSLIVS